MKGVPLRLEIGPRDIEKNQCVLVRRDNREKTVVSLDELEAKVPELLRAVHDGLYQKALANREARTWTARTFDELKALAAEKSRLLQDDVVRRRGVRADASRRRRGSPPAACPSSRSGSATSARSAAGPPRPRSSGAGRTDPDPNFPARAGINSKRG